jgi:hypothetical protein
MTNKYEVKHIGSENGEEVIYRIEDGVWIPFDPANSDYQRYLRWLENPDAEEGGTL